MLFHFTIQAVRHPGEMKLSKFQPSEKLFKRYDDKIKIDKYEGPAFNKVLEQGKRADKDRYWEDLYSVMGTSEL